MLKEEFFFVYVLIIQFLLHHALSANDAYAYEYPSYDEYSGNTKQYTYPSPSELMQTIDAHKASLSLLFQSEEETEKTFLSLVDANSNYWTLDQASQIIWTNLQKNDKGLNAEEIKNVDVILDAIEKEMDDVINKPGYNPAFFKTLNTSKRIVDCALGRIRRNILYSDLEKSFFIGEWNCDPSIPRLWWNLTNADYSRKQCTFYQAMQTLIDIQQAAKSKHTGYYIEPSDLHKIKLQLLLILSKSPNLKYISPFLCGDIPAYRCTTYLEVICGVFQYTVVSDITKKIDYATAEQKPESIEEMMLLLEIQRGLGNVSSQLTSITSVRNSPSSQSSARQMLSYYLGIVDTAIGNTSIDTWKQTSRNSTLLQFQDILLNSDDYVGYAVDLILKSYNTKIDLDKETLSVLMQKISANLDKKVSVDFSFKDAQIWVDNISATQLNNSDFNAYALYYKSWYEVLKQIEGKSGNNMSSSVLTNLNQTMKFVGKGGVISLSAKTKKQKESIPVFYKMNFDEEVSFIDNNGDVVRHCFSCHYLDATSGTWETKGCAAQSADDVGVTCHCNHTTNFAAFMMPYEKQYVTTETQDMLLNVLEYIGSVTSSIGLLISLVVFFIVKNNVRNDRLKAHMNLATALLFVHLIQLVTDYAIQFEIMCISVTIASNYFLLASFMWMLIEGIFLYLYVVQVFMPPSLENRWWMYFIGWVFPLIVVALTAGYGLPNEIYIQPIPPSPAYCNDGEILYPPMPESNKDLKYQFCWLSSESGMTWTFVAPAIAVIAINIVILIKVIMVLVRLSDRSQRMKPFQSTKQAYSNYNFQGGRQNSAPSVLIISSKQPGIEEAKNERAVSNDDTMLHHASLHANVLTSSSSPATSRSGSQSNSKNLMRPRAISTQQASDNTFYKDAKTAIKGSIVLLPLLGIPWIFGIFGYQSYAFSLIVVLLNSTQGAAIFLVYCVFNGEVCRALNRYIELKKMKGYGRSRTSSTSSLRSAFNKGVLRNWRRRSTAVSTLSTNQS